MPRPVDLTNPIFTDLEAARKHFEAIRWPNGPCCPFCGGTERVAPLGGKSMGPGWYHCKDCRRKFTPAVGTIYERSHVPLTKWFLATHLLCSSKKGMSAHQLGRMLGLPYKTSWFVAHRIREAMRDGSMSPLGGNGAAVEADETYYGQKNDPALRRKPGQRGPAGKRPVVGLVERGGRVRTFHVEKADRGTVEQVVRDNVDRETALMTDESGLYPKVGSEFASHGTVCHSAGEHVRGEVHTNTIDGYWSIFKRGMRGVDQHCGEQHLHRYLAEFDFRYNERAALGVSDAERATKAVRGVVGKRLTYQQPDRGQGHEARL